MSKGFSKIMELAASGGGSGSENAWSGKPVTVA